MYESDAVPPVSFAECNDRVFFEAVNPQAFFSPPSTSTSYLPPTNTAVSPPSTSTSYLPSNGTAVSPPSTSTSHLPSTGTAVSPPSTSTSHLPPTGTADSLLSAFSPDQLPAYFPLSDSVSSFTQSLGISVTLPPEATAVDYFELFFTPSIIEHIVDQTNSYASQMTTPPQGWQQCTPNRLRSFLGLVIVMGIKRMPNLRDYWSQHTLLGCPEVVSSWPYNQFRALLSCLHFNDNSSAVPKGQPGYDRLHKVRPLLSMVSDRCISVYRPKRELSLDEAMVGFKGRSSIKQYLPMKPTKRGFKVWCLCEASSGYLLSFSVYTGAVDRTEHNLGEKVVLHLSAPFFGLGYAIFCDNYFSSVKLAQELLLQNTYICSTTRMNRKKFPNQLKNVVLQARGDYQCVIVDGSVEAVAWKDKKDVHFLNTFYAFKHETHVKRKQIDGSSKEVKCPVCVKGYNVFMGGVDLCDQFRKVLSCSRKSNKWYMRLVWFIVDICIINAFILAKKSNYKKGQKEFRLELAHQYTSLYIARKLSGRPKSHPLPARLTERHFPEHSMSRRRCHVCMRRSKIEKRTQYFCRECNLGLCPDSCFKLYHTKEKYWL